MPELCRFAGIIIKLLYNDTVQHNKPHVHVFYGEYEASVGVDGELLAGALPVKQLRIVVGWLALHEEEVYAAWNKAVRGEPFEKISLQNFGIERRQGRQTLEIAGKFCYNRKNVRRDL